MAERAIKVVATDGKLVFNVNGEEPLTFDPSRASEANRKHAEMHGWKQRISDAAALDKGASPAAKRAEMVKLVQFYEAGGEEWNMAKAGGGARPYDVGAVVTAICAVFTNGDVDKANRIIDATAEKRGVSRVDAAKLYAADERVAVEMAKAKARLAPKFDVDAMLAEVDAPEASDEPTSDE